MSTAASRNYVSKLQVGISDMKISNEPQIVLETHSLGSCLGVAAHDAEAGVGGLLHFQLPLSKKNPERAARNPAMFGDTGLTALLEQMYALGAVRKRLVVRVAGGSAPADRDGMFNIGQRNYTVVKKFLWKNGIFIAGEDVGGDRWRNMRLEIGSGRVWIKDQNGEFEL